jgi:hypothetical protein
MLRKCWFEDQCIQGNVCALKGAGLGPSIVSSMGLFSLDSGNSKHLLYQMYCNGALSILTMGTNSDNKWTVNVQTVYTFPINSSCLKFIRYSY